MSETCSCWSIELLHRFLSLSNDVAGTYVNAGNPIDGPPDVAPKWAMHKKFSARVMNMFLVNDTHVDDLLQRRRAEPRQP